MVLKIVSYNSIMSYYIILRGPLGSGKSTISEKLAELLKAKHFSIDRVLDQHHLEEWEDGYISQKSFLKANEIAAAEAKKFLDKGTPIIFDGNFYWKSQIEDLIKRLKKYRSFVFTLRAPLEVCIERDSKRQKVHGSDAAIAVYKKSTEFKYGIGIDATKPLPVILKEILHNLT